MLLDCGSVCAEAHLQDGGWSPRRRSPVRQAENYTSQHPRGARTTLPEILSVIQPAFRLLPPARKQEMWSRCVWWLLRSEGRGDRRVWSPGGPFSLALRRDFVTTTTKEGYDMRRVDITPLEQRKLTFDTHALVQDLETHGFDKAQAETIVSALTTLSNVSLDSIYKEMVTRAQQKMKTELEQVKQQLINETSQIRADNKLDINLERSRVTDMFTDQEKKLMEATTEFTRKDTQTRSIISETSNKIDTEIASLKTLMESNKLETIRYLAASVFTCLAIALGFYRIWK
ncbi:coiled-coil domain-containing protein 90B, mitochondrial isoform X7 [Canis lupus familiaris]|uniref:coiled-coil domain-containing protein 90B, mitochondrial isoform X7 n=2 Tax=Canis lupus familiaris TaxID=9615 RepID=UPI0018F47F7D|nr:coiled-coil domain-containing protein 90B, mitochondrial isoform X7 [Canis lupus familiaris]